MLLHGFGGTHRMWDRVIARLDAERYLPLALDLPGHGARGGDGEPITFEGTVASVLAQAPERFALCGYSMGGRIALAAALATPARVRRLILIACDPGIEDERERAVRRDADEALARELEGEGLEAFAGRWNTLPLFDADPPEVAALAKADQLRNEARALATALRALGTGAMAPLWARAADLEMPVTFVAGERDAKFRAIGRRLAALAPSVRVVVLPGGHRLALENPDGVARVLAADHAGSAGSATGAGARSPE